MICENFLTIKNIRECAENLKKMDKPIPFKMMCPISDHLIYCQLPYCEKCKLYIEKIKK